MLRRPSESRPLPVIESPDDLMVGTCASCKTAVEVRRANATAPRTGQSFGQRLSAGGRLGIWQEAWSVECPHCRAKSARVTTPDGVVQALEGPRVYLMRKQP